MSDLTGALNAANLVEPTGSSSASGTHGVAETMTSVINELRSAETGEVTLDGLIQAVETGLATKVSSSAVKSIVQQVGPTVYNIMDPAYTTAGTPGAGNATADTTALTNAAAAMRTAGSGRLYLPPGLYKPTTMPSFAPVATTGRITLPYAISGEGKTVTIIQPSNTTLASSLTVSDPAFNPSNAAAGAPTWAGFTIDGSNASGTAVGVCWGDVSNGSFRDMRVVNFPAGDGFYFPNRYGWTEQIIWNNILVENCANLIHLNVLSTNSYAQSFDYWDMNGVTMLANANQNGWCSEAATVGLTHVGSKIRFSGNFQNGSTNTGNVFLLKGNDVYDYGVEWAVHCETDGGAAANHAGFTLSANTSYIGGNGTIYLGGFNANSYAGGSYQFQPTGWVTLAGAQNLPLVTGPTINRNIFGVPTTGGTGTNAYPTTLTSGSSVQNTTGTDLLVTIPVTFTGTGTAGWNVDTYNSLAAGEVVAGGPAGVKVPLTFVHYAGAWARVDVTAATIGNSIVRPV